MAYQSKISVLITAATETYYNGEAFGITSENDVGLFDVLEGHTSFISLIKNKIIVYKTENDKLEIPLTRGVLTVLENKVKVYIGL